ncbi:MAG: hypothetical protein NVS3B21_20550 [Acidimicrobiales bacterium]
MTGEDGWLQGLPTFDVNDPTPSALLEDSEHERLRAIISLHRDLADAEFDTDGVVEWLVQRSRVLFGDHEASLGLIDGDEIVYTIVTRPRVDLPRNTTPLGASMSGQCVASGETMVSDDIETDPRCDVAACRRVGIRSMVLVPLRHGGKIVGVLNVNSATPFAFSPREISTIELVGGVVSAAYAHAADLAATRVLLTELKVTVAALRTSEARLAHDVLHDPLTQLPNRLLFMERLRFALRRRGPKSVAVMFIDLDRFKVVNDSLGHDAGDVLLKVIASRLAGCLRQSDCASRFGGDEFTVLFEGVEGPKDALRAAGRITQAVGERVALPGGEVFPTVSVGIALCTGEEGSAEVLLKNADIALYRAKRSGRNRAVLFAGCEGDAASTRLEFENELRRAIDSDELVLHYQPQFRIGANEPVGVEALVRWQHPSQGLLGPDRFLGVADESGMIEGIGRWGLDHACRQSRQWAEVGGRPIPVAVNMSSRQLDDPGLVAIVEGALLNSGLQPSGLCIEVLETALIGEGTVSHRNLRALHDLGVVLDIDDFGVGQSSLAQLTRFPIRNLKIDRSLIDRVTEEDAIVVAVVRMAHALGFGVTAEGVETQDQYDALARIGCDYVQGFLLCRPTPAAELDLVTAF